jgi:hypothetical protein
VAPLHSSVCGIIVSSVRFVKRKVPPGQRSIAAWIAGSRTQLPPCSLRTACAGVLMPQGFAAVAPRLLMR